jgi:hypothetical protein
MTLSDREDNIYNQAALGNIPQFYRNLKPVTITENMGGQDHTATYYVIPDYLALGSDADSFLTPMTPILAQQIANLAGCSLPTRKMVNAIWSQADMKLAPAPIAPSAEMITVPVFDQHNTMVWNQREPNLTLYPLGSLVGGDKKDVVITPLIHSCPAPPRVAIYGWHQLNGSPIQPLSLVHEETYADYSHGIRLVSNAMVVDGLSKTVQEVLNDANLAGLLSDEGVVSNPKYPPTAPPGVMPFSDSFPSTGRDLSDWKDKFTAPQIVAFSPASPGGDGYALVVKDSSGGMETTRIGFVGDNDYYVQCDIYCEYRPELASDGFERAGIFARDNGNGAFEHTTGGGGYCYGMAWDSHNGRLWCFKSVNGIMTDFNPSPVYLASSGWRRMVIQALGNHITFICDDEDITDVTDDAFSWGQSGIGFHEYFTTNSNMKGARADNFNAGRLFPEPTPTPTPTPSPSPGNLVINGGFEGDFVNGAGAGWTKWQATGSGAITYGQASINKHEGDHSQYWSRSDTALLDGGVYQTISVTSGNIYEISAWIKRQSTFNGTILKFGYDLSEGTDGTGGSVVYSDPGGGDNVWMHYGATLAATGNTLTLFARGGHTETSGGANACFYLDEVSMVQSPDTPTPSPTPLPEDLPSGIVLF